MNAEEYLLLYEKYIAGLCSAAEEEQLFAYQDAFKLQPGDLPEQQSMQADLNGRIYERIVDTISEPAKKTHRLHLIYKIAAVLLCTIGVAYLYQNYSKSEFQRKNLVRAAGIAALPIKPGRSTAQLILSDGSVLNLDQAKNGLITTVEESRINKFSTGSIRYSKTNAALAEATNTLTVPAGGSYNVVLPDGTSVWLNSLSSLTYPLNFNGKTRTVSLKGEAYFEVTKNPKLPFVVQVNAMSVTVLGTHFNVNAYPEHTGIQTTLLEGSVRLSQASKTVMLRPGEQGNVDRESSEMQVSQVNTNKVVGWKNGYFMFQDDNIKDIMEQIARWYDLDVEYRGDLQNKKFGGIYSRNKDIKELLKGLELTGLVYFKIEGRRVIVMA